MRQYPTSDVLVDLVRPVFDLMVDELNTKVRDGFTAYEVTLQVRQNNPDYEIVHSNVRNIVQYMYSLGDGELAVEKRDYNNPQMGLVNNVDTYVLRPASIQGVINSVINLPGRFIKWMTNHV